jgi:hypothetical protein
MVLLLSQILPKSMILIRKWPLAVKKRICCWLLVPGYLFSVSGDEGFGENFNGL